MTRLKLLIRQKKAIYRRYEIENRLDRVEKQTEPEWKQEVAALDSVKQADRFLAALVAQQVARLGRWRWSIRRC